MTRSPSSTRRLVVLSSLGVLVGCGLGGAVALAVRTNRPFSDEGTRDALRKIPESGPALGPWSFEDDERNQSKGVLEADPSAPGQFRWTAEGQPPKSTSKERVSYSLLGAAPDAFLANYAPVGPAEHENREGRLFTRVLFNRSDGSAGPGRWLTKDDETGEIVGIEDVAFDGRFLRKATLEITITRVRRPAPNALSARYEGPCPADLASSVPFTLYEPSRLPKGYQRIMCTDRPLRHAMPDIQTGDLVLFRYGDGLAQFDLFLVRPEILETLVTYAKSMQRSGGIATCPSTADKPEDLVEGAVVIRRRSSRCRTVLQREDLSGVRAVLVSFNEVPADVYIDVMRSLAPVEKRSAEKPEKK